MSKIKLPKTIGEATTALDGLDKLLTAKEWQKAAIVFAFTAPGQKGRPREMRNVAHFISFREFSELGINGLTSDRTVAFYYQAWIDGGGDADIKPGDSVTLPTGKFPPTDKRTGNFDERIVTQARNAKPEVQEAIVREIAKTAPRTVGEVAGETPAALDAAIRRGSRTGKLSGEGRARTEKATEDIELAFLPAALARRALEEVRQHYSAWSKRSPAEAEAFLRWLEEVVADLRVSKEAAVSDEEIAAFLGNT